MPFDRWIFVPIVDVFRVIFLPTHLRRTLTITLAVGSWLTLMNQGDVILQSGWSKPLILKLALNYLTPFVVANLGLLSRAKAAAQGNRNITGSGMDDRP